MDVPSMSVLPLGGYAANFSVTTITYDSCPTPVTVTSTALATSTYCPLVVSTVVLAQPTSPLIDNKINININNVIYNTIYDPNGNPITQGLYPTVFPAPCPNSPGMCGATYTLTEQCPCTGLPAQPVPSDFTTTVEECGRCGPNGGKATITKTVPCETGVYAAQTPAIGPCTSGCTDTGADSNTPSEANAAGNPAPGDNANAASNANPASNPASGAGNANPGSDTKPAPNANAASGGAGGASDSKAAAAAATGAGNAPGNANAASKPSQGSNNNPGQSPAQNQNNKAANAAAASNSALAAGANNAAAASAAGAGDGKTNDAASNPGANSAVPLAYSPSSEGKRRFMYLWSLVLGASVVLAATLGDAVPIFLAALLELY